MKKNYDIRVNPKPLSAQQVARHKNFDALLTQFQAQPKSNPIIRRLVLIGSSIAASLALLFFVYQFTKPEFQARQAAYFDSKDYISQPFQSVKPSFASYKVDPDEGGVYNYPSGSKVIVPASAFADEKGTLVSGEVTLHYREMHDFVDFFVSGIPMTYDSAGVSYNLESAGMIEIFAEQNGRRVNMAPGKTINVELVSNVNTAPNLNVPPGYNIYKLDKDKRNWVYQDIDRMEVLSDAPLSSNLDENSPFFPAQKELAERMLAIQVTEATELSKIEKSIPKLNEPLKPQRANGKDYVFNLDLDEVFPANAPNTIEEETELREMYRQYSKMLWQLSPKSAISPERLQKEFAIVNGLSIKKLNETDYELTLESSKEQLKVIVNPVLTGTDYQKATKKYNQDLSNWQKAVAEREAKLNASKATLAQRLEKAKQAASLDFEKKVEELRNKGYDFAATSEIIKKKVVNRFTASEFGIWNCDRPLPPEMLEIAANFKDENGRKLSNRTAYLVDKSRNTVYQFLAEKGTELRFNRNSENLLWLVTDENKIAVFRPEQFKKIGQGEKEYDFVLQTVDKKIETEQDIREILVL